MPTMTNRKRQMIVLGVLSSVFVIILFHQLLHKGSFISNEPVRTDHSNTNGLVSRDEDQCVMNKGAQCKGGNAEADTPHEPLLSVPQEPLSLVPQEPLSSVPQEPLSSVPQEPLSSVPQEPLSSLPQDGKNILCRGKKCPNIIYLLADDLGYGDVEYNKGVALTPHLNSMASGPHSVHFKRFYSGGPSCSPTRGTLLTGRNHNRYCIWHADLGDPKIDLTCPSLGPLPPSELTVAEVLQGAGYHTSIYGKWHVGDLRPIKGGNTKWNVSHPGMHGFREWWVTERQVTTLLPNCKCSKDYSCRFDARDYYVRFCQNYWRMNDETGKLEKYPMQIFDDSDFLVDRLENLLKTRDPSVPFFTILAFHSVHAPFLSKPHWLQHYGKKGYSSKKVDYLGSTSGLDEAIGRVRRLLKEYGVYDNTMLWFSSDNGPQKGGPGSSGGLRGLKGDLWEGGIRVPGIIEWPAAISENRVSSVPVVTSDLLPTVADIVGVDLPSDIKYDGISLLPLLTNKTDRRGSNINFAFHILKGNLDSSYKGAVVGDRYKYYAEFDRGHIRQFYLFDMEREANEKTNVSKSHPQVTASLRGHLEDFLKSVNSSATDIGCLSTHDRRSDTIKCY
ncbi:Steryl-sulfatase [Geodia barretti]|uniref:Steryl-sulfatase n=1 Tax=Geodia barretti TaxID=519541 RepID=A0AA35WGK6_GEOBA|nr:Steryl-sulfatase [Geodia barretti]